MSDSQEVVINEVTDIPTTEEQEKINSIQKEVFTTSENQNDENAANENVKQKVNKPFSIWSLFGLNLNNIILETRQPAPFGIKRWTGVKKVVTINNISGKNAYVILTPATIKSIESVGVGINDVSFNINFSEKGEYKSQQIPMLNNQRSEYDLDNSQFYCTLFLQIDDKWKKTWENRKFNGRIVDINILERHVILANELESLPTI